MKSKIIDNKKEIIAAIILIFCEWFFFRNVVGVGTDALIGDRGDGRLTMLLTEHWFNFFSGREKAGEIAMFYPCNESIGYTDLLFLYGCIHSLFRLSGCSVFSAYKWTLIVVHFFGVVGMFYLMCKKMKCSVEWSLFGTLAFNFSNIYAVHMFHTQIDAIAFLPLLLIFIIGFASDFRIRYKRNIYAYSFIIGFVLLTYNSWYIACFTGIYIMVFILCFLFIQLKQDKTILRSCVNCLKRLNRSDILGYIVTTVLLYIPFLNIYIPVIRESSGYTYLDCVNYLPEPADIINVSEYNWMFGWLVKMLGMTETSISGFPGEKAVGFSFVLIVLFLHMIYKIRTDKPPLTHLKGTGYNNIYSYNWILLLTAVYSTVVCFILTIKLNSKGVSLWWFVYTLLPVARSLRAIARFWIWLSFPVSIITTYTADKYYDPKNGRKRKELIYLLILLFLSNITIEGVSSVWNENDERIAMDNVQKPPDDADIFYITDGEEVKIDNGYYLCNRQLDAYEIADKYRLKTINGYSGRFPKDWEELWDIDSDNYEFAVYEWINSHNLKNVYCYEIATNTWVTHQDKMDSIVDSVFSPVDNRFSLSSGLKEYGQEEYVWTGKSVTVILKNSEIRNNGLAIKLGTPLSYYLKQDPEIQPELDIYVDGELIKNIDISDEYLEIRIPMMYHMDDMYCIKIETNCSFIPKEIGLNEDGRDLSLELFYLGI